MPGPYLSCPRCLGRVLSGSNEPFQRQSPASFLSMVVVTFLNEFDTSIVGDTGVFVVAIHTMKGRESSDVFSDLCMREFYEEIT